MNLSNTGTFRIVGGTLSGGTVNAPAGLMVTPSGGTLDRLTVQGNIDLTAASAMLIVSNGLTLGGTLTMGNHAAGSANSIQFTTTETISAGTSGAVIQMGTSSSNSLAIAVGNASVTFGAGVQVLGSGSFLETYFTSNGSFINNGTITASAAAGKLDVQLPLTNNGTAGASAGTLNLNAATTNNGTLNATGGAVNLNWAWTNRGAFSVSGSSTVLTVKANGTWSSTAPLTNTGATVTFNLPTAGTVTVTGMMTLSGNGVFQWLYGTLVGGTVTETNSAVMRLNGTAFFYGITWNGDLDGATNNCGLVLKDAFTLNNGALSLGNQVGTTKATVLFLNALDIGGNGTFLLGGNVGNALSLNSTSATVAFGPNLVVKGKTATLNLGGAFTGSSFVKHGKIMADTAGGTFTISAPFTNAADGTIAADGMDGILYVRAALTNTGTVKAAGGTLWLFGTWTNAGTFTASAGTLACNGSGSGGTWSSDVPLTAEAGATVNFNGVLTIQNTLMLSGPGAFRLAGGTLTGTITETDQAVLLGLSGTLKAVTLNGDLDMTTGTGNVAVSDGLLLNGTISLGNLVGSTAAQLTFTNTETVDGGAAGGTIILGGNNRNLLYISGDDHTVTFGPNLLVRGKSGVIGTGLVTASNYVNWGTVTADVGGGTITLDKPWTNNGALIAQNGGTLSLSTAPTNYDSGTLTGGTLRVPLSVGGAGAAGLLTVNGSFTQTAAGVLKAARGPKLPCHRLAQAPWGTRGKTRSRSNRYLMAACRSTGRGRPSISGRSGTWVSVFGGGQSWPSW